MPGDEIMVECDFDTKDRNRFTFGGFPTAEEMCLVFLTYYPAVNLGACFSRPSWNNIFSAYGIEDVYGYYAGEPIDNPGDYEDNGEYQRWKSKFNQNAGIV